MATLNETPQSTLVRGGHLACFTSGENTYAGHISIFFQTYFKSSNILLWFDSKSMSCGSTHIRTFRHMHLIRRKQDRMHKIPILLEMPHFIFPTLFTMHTSHSHISLTRVGCEQECKCSSSSIRRKHDVPCLHS
jgi:hypothetical protein